MFIVQCARKIFGLLQNKAVEILHFVIIIKKLLHETREIKKNNLISLICMYRLTVRKWISVANTV